MEIWYKKKYKFEKCKRKKKKVSQKLPSDKSLIFERIMSTQYCIPCFAVLYFIIRILKEFGNWCHIALYNFSNIYIFFFFYDKRVISKWVDTKFPVWASATETWKAI